ESDLIEEDPLAGSRGGALDRDRRPGRIRDDSAPAGEFRLLLSVELQLENSALRPIVAEVGPATGQPDRTLRFHRPEFDVEERIRRSAGGRRALPQAEPPGDRNDRIEQLAVEALEEDLAP